MFNNKDRITPLDKIKKGVRNMNIRARVVSKGSIKYFGKEKMFKIEIFDGTLPFSTLVVFSCPDCDGFFNGIELGYIYKFSKGQIVSDQQKNMTRNCIKYDLFDPTYISRQEETPADQNTLNFNKFELLKLSQITDKNITTHFDVLAYSHAKGIVLEDPIKDTQQTQIQNGLELEAWRLTIGDESGKSAQVSIRNEAGLEISTIKMMDVILIKSCHINIYAQQKTLDSGSGIFINPFLPEAVQLLQQFQSFIYSDGTKEKTNAQNEAVEDQANNKIGRQFEQLGDGKISMHSYEVRSIFEIASQIDQLLDRINSIQTFTDSRDDYYLQKELNTCYYSDVICQISSTSAEKRPYYLACSVCSRKVSEFNNNQCVKNCANSMIVGKISINMTIADASGAISALAFNDQCNMIFGFDGEIIRKLDELSKSNQVLKKDLTIKDLFRLSYNKPFKMRITSSVQFYEKKYVPKHQITACQLLDIKKYNVDTMQAIEEHLQKHSYK